jgi:hypothetical protein
MSEGAIALIPYFLKGITKEGYRAQLGNVPVSMPKYPFMVQYLLETDAVDEELAKAFYAAAYARQIEGEDELAGNVIDQMNLNTIYTEDLPPYVQAGLCLHVTPGTSFDQVQRMALNLGTSLRQTVAPTVKVIKTPSGVKPLLARGNSVQLVGEDDESETAVADTEQMTLDGDAREIPVDVHAMWKTPQTSGKASSSLSPSLSAVSFPTRG